MHSPIDDGHKNAAATFVRNIMPSHEVWCEPYFQMEEVFFKKKPSKKEIINDKDNNIVNFYLMLRSRWEQLYFLMEGTLHCDFLSQLAEKVLEDESNEDLYRAWAFWLKCNKAFVTPEKWSLDDILPVSNSTQSEIQKKVMKHLSDRLANAYISNREPLEVILEADGENTLFYMCPRNRKELKALESIWKDINGQIILQTPEESLMKKMMKTLDIYTDDDCRPLGLYTNFKRQHSLFDE